MQFYPEIEGQTRYLGARGSDSDLPSSRPGSWLLACRPVARRRTIQIKEVVVRLPGIKLQGKTVVYHRMSSPENSLE